MAPEDVVRKTFQATTQMAMSVESDNRSIPRRHYKSRFPFLREKRINDTFHSDTFFPSTTSIDGHTCSQLFLGRDTDYMYVQPMKTESHSHVALQDFGRKVGLPIGIKTDNAKTEIGSNWTNWCRQYCVSTKFTEPHSPWQNVAEQGIGDLGRMVRRCMSEFEAPLSRHSWCQKWCCDVRNHLASRKLEWRTAREKLTGETPDISVFRFHFWQPVEYFNHDIKQPGDGWMPGRFLGIAWDSGDDMTYFIETESHGKGRPSVLTRSTVRPRDPGGQVFPINPSGEEPSNDLEKLAENEVSMTEDQPNTIDSDDDPEDERDDGQINWEADGLENDDQLNISEELSNLSIGDEEDT